MRAKGDGGGGGGGRGTTGVAGFVVAGVAGAGGTSGADPEGRAAAVAPTTAAVGSGAVGFGIGVAATGSFPVDLRAWRRFRTSSSGLGAPVGSGTPGVVGTEAPPTEVASADGAAGGFT